MKKEDNTDWNEFTQDLDSSLKLIELHEDYNHQQHISYKNNEYIDTWENYYECVSCNQVYLTKSSISKFCTECGCSKTKEYRNNRICHDCKITFKGKFCPECGHGELWDEQKKEKNRVIALKIAAELKIKEQELIEICKYEEDRLKQEKKRIESYKRISVPSNSYKNTTSNIGSKTFWMWCSYYIICGFIAMFLFTVIDWTTNLVSTHAGIIGLLMLFCIMILPIILAIKWNKKHK